MDVRTAKKDIYLVKLERKERFDLGKIKDEEEEDEGVFVFEYNRHHYTAAEGKRGPSIDFPDDFIDHGIVNLTSIISKGSKIIVTDAVDFLFTTRKFQHFFVLFFSDRTRPLLIFIFLFV